MLAARKGALLARQKIKLDSAGILEVLKSGEVAEVILSTALSVESAASHVTARGVDIPTEVSERMTDRATASVTLAHPAGVAIEAKHGVLASAAASAGLDVRLYGGK